MKKLEMEARTSIRMMNCEWQGCDAVLNSSTSLAHHAAGHASEQNDVSLIQVLIKTVLLNLYPVSFRLSLAWLQLEAVVSKMVGRAYRSAHA